MGGAGGHMWHPFDCPDVNSGQDLISFFQKSIESAKARPPALKIDGVNLSFRLRENPSMETGYEFVIDRGSMKALDVQGVTADNAHERFVSKDPSQPHGMINATEILLSIFNAALPEVISDLEQLGMTEDIGPYGKYFNTEFVLKKINVKEYAFDFIALHGVNQFVKKGPRSRKGVAAEADQVILDTVRDKVRKYAAEKDFRVFTRIPAEITKEVELEKALDQEFTVVYSSQMRDPEDTGELGIGEGSTKTIRDWLSDVSENPLNKVVYISNEMRQKYPQMSKKQSPYAKNIYLEVLKGTPVNEIAATEEDIEPLVDAAVIMHSTRILGNAMLDALESDEFGAARDQEGVVVNDPDICGGTSFKFTGDFIVGGLATSFPREQKFRKGKLLESFMPEPVNLNEQGSGQYVILIPGGFKPPTGGHYSMIKEYEKKADVMKVYVVTGPKEREGVTLDQSKQIFKIYGGFSSKVEFIEAADATPLTTCYKLMENDHFVSEHAGGVFSIGAGNKGGDPKRIKDFVKYFKQRIDSTTAQITAYPPAETLTVDGQPASASRMREAFKNGDWETFKKLLPDDNFYDDVVQVMNKQGSQINESFFLTGHLFSLVDEVLLEEKKKPNPWAICTDKVGREDKDKYERCVKGVKSQHGITEEINEQEELKLEPEQTKELQTVISNLIQKFIESGMAPELKVATGIEKGDIDIEDSKQSLINTIMSYVGGAIDDIMEEEQEVNEVSAMAAGAVAGAPRSPWENLDYEEA